MNISNADSQRREGAQAQFRSYYEGTFEFSSFSIRLRAGISGLPQTSLPKMWRREKLTQLEQSDPQIFFLAQRLRASYADLPILVRKGQKFVAGTPFCLNEPSLNCDFGRKVRNNNGRGCAEPNLVALMRERGITEGPIMVLGGLERSQIEPSKNPPLMTQHPCSCGGCRSVLWSYFGNIDLYFGSVKNLQNALQDHNHSLLHTDTKSLLPHSFYRSFGDLPTVDEAGRTVSLFCNDSEINSVDWSHFLQSFNFRDQLPSNDLVSHALRETLSSVHEKREASACTFIYSDFTIATTGSVSALIDTDPVVISAEMHGVITTIADDKRPIAAVISGQSRKGYLYSPLGNSGQFLLDLAQSHGSNFPVLLTWKDDTSVAVLITSATELTPLLDGMIERGHPSLYVQRTDPERCGVWTFSSANLVTGRTRLILGINMDGGTPKVEGEREPSLETFQDPPLFYQKKIGELTKVERDLVKAALARFPGEQSSPLTPKLSVAAIGTTPTFLIDSCWKMQRTSYPPIADDTPGLLNGLHELINRLSIEKKWATRLAVAVAAGTSLGMLSQELLLDYIFRAREAEVTPPIILLCEVAVDTYANGQDSHLLSYEAVRLFETERALQLWPAPNSANKTTETS